MKYFMITKFLNVDKWNPDPDVIREAASVLQNEGLVAFPTETVYGLGANGLNGEAVKKIFAAKGRPADNPLILHISHPNEAQKFAIVDERAKRIINEFFPAPLTLVLPVKPCVPREVTAGLNTVAFRMPSHPVALALIEKAGFPIAAPSANKSGRPSPTDAHAVMEDLGNKIDMVLESGECDIGVESTVIDISQEKIFLLRPGGMPTENIEKFLGIKLLNGGETEKKSSPGTRYRHYAPNIPLFLLHRGDKEFNFSGAYGYMGIKEPDFYCNGECRSKIIFENVENYARGVFAALRKMEKEGLGCIIAELPENKGVGLALHDRLLRASGCL